MKRIAFLLLFSALCLASFGYNVAGTYTEDRRGIILPTPDGGRLCVEMVRPDIVRVRHSVSGELLDTNPTGICVPHPGKNRFSVRVLRNGADWLLVSDSLLVEIPTDGSGIVFRDWRTKRIIGMEKTELPREGRLIVDERIVYDETSRRTVQTADGEKEVRDILRRDTIGSTYSYTLHWQFTNGEAVYGLGSHMENYMNLRDKRLYLCQHNLKAMVPVLSSTAGYGLLIDAGSEMRYDRGRIGIEEPKRARYRKLMED